MNICSIIHCGNKVFSSGYCRTHHRWWKRGKDMNSIPRVHKYIGPCIIEGCEEKPKSRKMCERHYGFWKRHGDPLFVVNKQSYTDANGYVVWNKSHPQNSVGRPVLAHRQVMMNLLGRNLLTHESVHHKNGDRSDNRPENLELWSRSQPAGQRVEDKLAWAREIIKLYGDNNENKRILD